MRREGGWLIVRGCLAAWLVWAAAGVCPSWAQSKPAGPPDKAPVMTFAPGGISLDDAVAVALKHDPALRTAQNDMQRLEGALQEQRGRFDFTLRANFDFSYREQELSETRKADEIKKRKNVQGTIDSMSANSTVLGQEIVLLSQLVKTSPGDPLVKQLLAFSPSIASQIEILDAMILSSATPASVRPELARIRTETIQEYLAASTSQKAQIDAANLDAKTRLANLGDAPIDEFFRSGSVSITLAKLFRSGASLSPFVDGSIETTTYVGKPISATYGGKGVQDQEKIRFGADFTLPVLRGRGADAFASGEKAAKVQLDAGRLAAEHQAATSALAVVRAYWALRAAAESLEATARSTELQAQVVDITQALIQAGEMPAVELARAQAGAARSKAAAKDAERRYLEARVALASAMGVASSQDDSTLPTVKDSFPALVIGPDPVSLTPDLLAADAVAQRRDLTAARKYAEASRIVERAAQLNTRPKLDVSGSTYYTALGERNFQRVVDRFVGPSLEVGLEFEKPFGNNQLQGARVQREAEHRQQQIAAAELERQVKLGVVRAATSLKQALEHAKEAVAAVQYYQKTVDAELARFKVGESTLINTLLTERQLTDARLSAIAAQQQAAALIAELRYETGSLLNGTTVVPDAFVSLPKAGGR